MIAAPSPISFLPLQGGGPEGDGGHRDQSPRNPIITPALPLKGRGIGKGERGFTLIELMVVIVILAMAAALVIPRLPSTEGTKLKTSAANLASALRFLNDQATLTKGVYRLHFNIAENGFSAAKLSQQGEELPPDDQFMTRRFIEDGISIQDVVAPRLGLVTEGEAVVALGPAGFPEPLVVHLKGGDKHFTVTAFPNGGRVVVQDGYQELGTDDLKEVGK